MYCKYCCIIVKSINDFKNLKKREDKMARQGPSDCGSQSGGHAKRTHFADDISCELKKGKEYQDGQRL